jgi:threonine aldolase
MTEILFGSDNQAGVSPQVMDAILRSDDGIAVAYGDDIHSGRLNAAFSDVFEHEAFVFSAATGTAANALGLATITPPYGETICHEAAHILTTEGGAPEFYAGGSRLVGIAGSNGKIAAHDLCLVLDERMRPSRHHFACSSLSLTQATEFGTLYTLAELEALSEAAHTRGLRVHMDGARFTNALVALGASPAAMSWRAGIDVLSLGTTKNGTMNAEAVIVFDRALGRDLAYRQKRGRAADIKNALCLGPAPRLSRWRALAPERAACQRNGEDRSRHPRECARYPPDSSGRNQPNLRRYRAAGHSLAGEIGHPVPSLGSPASDPAPPGDVLPG